MHTSQTSTEKVTLLLIVYVYIQFLLASLIRSLVRYVFECVSCIVLTVATRNLCSRADSVRVAPRSWFSCQGDGDCKSSHATELHGVKKIKKKKNPTACEAFFRVLRTQCIMDASYYFIIITK